MKKMKWMMALAFGFMSVAAFAQTEAAPAPEEQQTEQHRPHHRKGHAGMWQEDVKEYSEALKLTPEQTNRWEALNESNKAEIKTLRENSSLSKEEKKVQMKSLRQHKQAELQKILSEEQLAQYKELHKAKMQERKAHKSKIGDWKKSN